MNQDVLELPGILEVELIINQFVASVLERVPVSVVASHWSDVGFLNLQASLIVHLVALDQPSLGVLQGPGHPGDHSRADLEGSGTLVLGSLLGLSYVQLRTVPVGVLGMAVEQNAKLIHPLDDVFLNDLPVLLLGHAA